MTAPLALTLTSEWLLAGICMLIFVGEIWLIRRWGGKLGVPSTQRRIIKWIFLPVAGLAFITGMFNVVLQLHLGRRPELIIWAMPMLWLFAMGVGFVYCLRPVRREETEREFALNPGRCGQCGYDLTGNVSGRCPECGWGIPAEPIQLPTEPGWANWWIKWEIGRLQNARPQGWAMLLMGLLALGIAGVGWYTGWFAVVSIACGMVGLHCGINTYRIFRYLRREANLPGADR